MVQSLFIKVIDPLSYILIISILDTTNMEASLLSSLQTFTSLFFFTFTSLFFILSTLLYFLRLRPWCNCEVCTTYLQSSWKLDFDNLCDWYTHLLCMSPSSTIHIHVLGNTITANPDNVEYMLKTNFNNFPKGKPFSAILGDLLGHGIFNVDGEAWQFQRKMASLELGSLAVRSHAYNIVSTEIHKRLIPLLNQTRTLDLQDVFRRFSFDTICKISFGLDPGCLELSLPFSEFSSAFDTASRLSAWRGAAAWPMSWKIKRFFNMGSEKELRKAIQKVNMLAGEVIKQRRKLGFSSTDDLLSRFMSSVDDDKYLRDIVISFLLAGRDTVASGLTSFFFLLSKHPSVQAAILDEIATHVTGEVASYEEMRGMNYVHAAIYESMRLFPPVQFDSKFCLEDDVLPDGAFVQKGARVTYHPYAMGRMERVWGEDCEEFKPERWIHGGVFKPESPFRYPVFQGGLRVCIGKEMAIMEMKAVIVSVVREFDIEVHSERQTPKFAPGLTATIGGGLHAKVRRRVFGAY